MFGIRNGVRLNIRSSDGSIDVVQSGNDFDLTVDTAVVGGWTTVVDIDMETWATTDFAAGGDGNYVLGGLTWTAGSTANANVGSPNGGFFRRDPADIGDDGRGGLRIYPDQNVDTDLNRSLQTAPRLSIPLGTLIPSFDPTSRYRFELQLTRFDDNGQSFAGAAPTATMALFAPAGTPGGSTARFAGVGLQRSAVDDAQPTVLAGNSTRMPISAYTYQGGDDVIALQVSPSQQAAAMSGQFTADWPVSTSLRVVGSTSEQIDNNAAAPILDALDTLEIGVEVRVVQTGSIDVMFRRLRVLRAS